MSYHLNNFKASGKTYFLSLLLAFAVPLPWHNLVLAQSINSQSQVSLETNILYVDPQTGDDNGEGSEKLPLKTIAEALERALPNTIISLASGTYNEATGEKFPLIIQNNVTLQGITGGQGYNVVIEGSGYYISPTAAGQYVTMAAIKNAKAITGVTVINPHTRGHGLWIESASPTVSYSSFIQNGNTGLSVNGNSAPVITNNYFHHNGGNGLLVYGTSKPQVKDNTFESTGFAVSIVQKAKPLLIGNSFSGNRIGIILEGNSQAVLRNNKIENSEEYGLVAIANSQADLGTINEPGKNILRNNGKFDVQNATKNIFLAVETQVTGKTEGKIDFRGDTTPTIADREVSSTQPTRGLVLNAISPQQPVANNTNTIPTEPKTFEPLAEDLASLNSNETLPSPPPVPVPNSPPPSQDSSIGVSPPPPPTSVNNSLTDSHSQKEFVFTAQNNNSSSTLPSQSSLVNHLPNRQINTLSDVFNSPPPITTTNTTKYKVLVETKDSKQQTQVRSLYSEAFTTVYQGKSMLQIGAFSDKDKAEGAMSSLQSLGLKSYLLE